MYFNLPGQQYRVNFWLRHPTIEGATGEGGAAISPTTSTPSPSTELPTDAKGKSTIRFPEGSQPSPSPETSDDGGASSRAEPPLQLKLKGHLIRLLSNRITIVILAAWLRPTVKNSK